VLARSDLNPREHFMGIFNLFKRPKTEKEQVCDEMVDRLFKAEAEFLPGYK